MPPIRSRRSFKSLKIVFDDYAIDGGTKVAVDTSLGELTTTTGGYYTFTGSLTAKERELTTEQWVDVFRQAAELGVLQLHISGGEPASRRDLLELVIAAREGMVDLA